MTGSDLLLITLGNVAVVVGLWWRGGGLADIHTTAGALTSAGRITGLLGAFGILVQLLLVARIPALDRLVGFDRLTVWHRRNGRVALLLLLAHAALITLGYAAADRIAVPGEVGRLLSTYPGVLTATVGLGLLIAVVVTSVVIVKRRLRYETWYFVHLYSYLGIALAFSHQLAVGRDFIGNPVAQGYWYALYALTLGALVVFRVALPLIYSLRHQLRVARVVCSGPGVISMEITGRRLDRMRAESGHFFFFRFLTRDRWWEAHPFSLSAAPDGRSLRITVKDLGDHTGKLWRIPLGTRVMAEGPYGAFTSRARKRARVALIGAGVGITPIRALLEDTPGGPGDIAVVYRATHEDDLLFRDELDQLARTRGAEVHYLVGPRRGAGGEALLSSDHIRRLIPDIRARDVFVCGPPGLTAAVARSLRQIGAGPIITERFAF